MTTTTKPAAKAKPVAKATKPVAAKPTRTAKSAAPVADEEIGTAHPDVSVAKFGRRFDVVSAGVTVSTHTTKRAALAAADVVADERLAAVAATVEIVEQAVAEPVAKVKPAKAKAAKVPTLVINPNGILDRAPTALTGERVVCENALPVIDPASMSKLDRLAAAKAENDALREWKKNGSEGEAPATPVRDWMANPAQPAKAKVKGSTIQNDPVRDAAIREVIVAGRANGDSWWTIAATFNASDIPTARGGVWMGPQVWNHAKRLGLLAAPADTAVA